MAWMIFGLVGLMMGITWAAGIATSNASIDTAGASQAAAIFGTASASGETSQYDGLVTADTALEIGLNGRWGTIAADTAMFDVDLSSKSGSYFVEVFLSDAPSGWSAFHLELLQVDKACADAGAADWASPAASSVMVMEDVDSFVSFDSLAGGSTYCLGVQATSKANDAGGTFIRLANGATPTAPGFGALLNRES
jgi:hypothetical protein